VSISSFNSVFCSGVSFATHLALSNLGNAEVVEAKPLTVPVDPEETEADFGPPKKDVMLASVRDFLGAAAVDDGRFSALRFGGAPIGDDIGAMDEEKRLRVK
jgi:hypothetical protein